MNKLTLNPVTNLEEFVGRKQYLDMFEKYIHSFNFLILGEDGLGKSSFLRLLEESCYQRNLVTCKMKVHERESIQSFAKRFYETVNPLIPLPKTPKKKQTIINYFKESTIWWGNYFKEYFQKNFYRVREGAKKEMEESSSDYLPSFKQYLTNINENLDQNMVVFIDDIHSIESTALIISTMKNLLWTNFDKVKYVLFVNHKTLPSNQREKFIYLSKNKPVQHIELLVFSEEEARAYIIRNSKRRKVEISEGVINKILTLSGRYPYYLNILCYLIFKNIGEKNNITESEINEKIGQVEDKNKYNEYLYNLLDGQRKIAIEKIAQSSRGLSKNVLKKYLDINMNNQELEELIQNLEEDSYLRREDDLLVIFHPIFADFVRKITKGEPKEEFLSREAFDKAKEDEITLEPEEIIKDQEEIKEKGISREDLKDTELEENFRERKVNLAKVSLDDQREVFTVEQEKMKEEEEEEEKEINKKEGKKAEANRLCNRIKEYCLKAISTTKDVYWKSLYYVDIADCLKKVGRFEEASDYLIRASEFTDNEEEKAKLILKAREYLVETKKNGAEGLLEKALKIYLDASTKTSEIYWKAKYQWKVAECLLLLNQRDEAEKLAKEAIDYFVETAKITDDLYWKADYYRQAANCLKRLGKVEECQEMSETIINYYYRAIEKVVGDYWKAKYTYDVAEFIEENGQIEKAYDLYHQSANLYLQASKRANDPIRKVEDLQLSSKCLTKIGKAREAEKACEEITKLYLKTIKDIEDANLRAKSLKSIGDAYKSIGKLSEALGYYLDASKAIVEPAEEACYLSLAVKCLVELNRYKDAEKISREAIKNFKEASGTTSDFYWKAKYLKNALEVLLEIPS
ncbi:MAG: P-loop NTPase fold protein [bacterium]